MEKLEATGFAYRIVKPHAIETERIIAAQMQKPYREITCVFNAGTNDETTVTRSPYLHFENNMQDQIMTMFEEMIGADFILIRDISVQIPQS